MKLFRDRQVCISEKVDFYAHILCKALVRGTDASVTKDQFVDAELTDKWEHEHPELLEAWEKNTALRQQSKKLYQEAESEIIRLLTPLPGTKK